MAASPNHSIFTGSRATARIASCLQCRRLRGGIIPCENEGILFRDTSAVRRSEYGTFSFSWGAPRGRPRPAKKVLKIREVATEVAASSNSFIFMMPRDHLVEGRKS